MKENLSVPLLQMLLGEGSDARDVGKSQNPKLIHRDSLYCGMVIKWKSDSLLCGVVIKGKPLIVSCVVW